MLSGLMLILIGILILMEPRILVALLSGFLIATGLVLMVIHWRVRRVYRDLGQVSNRWTRFIFRF